MSDKKDKKTEKLLKEIEDLKEKNAELESNWKRSLADLQNFKKRAEQERNDFVKHSNFSLLTEVVPVLDNLEMLQAHIEDAGLKVTVSHFKDIIKRLGVVELDVINKPFDPHTSEAIEMVEVEGDKKGSVVEVLQPGYKYNDKILRVAKVKVGK